MRGIVSVAALATGLALSPLATECCAQNPDRTESVSYSAENAERNLRAAMADLEAWLATGPTGNAWREYLRLDSLESQLSKPIAARDPAAVSALLARLESGQPGLDEIPFARFHRALEEWMAATGRPSLETLVGGIQSNRDIDAPGDSDADRERDRLQATARRLDRYLARSGKNGDAWRRFLLWSELETQLAPKATPDPTVLSAILERFESGFPGLERGRFADTGHALRSYLASLRLLDDADAPANMQGSLDQLAAALETYQAGPTDESRLAIEEGVRHLVRTDRLAGIRAGIETRFSNPNLLVLVGEPFLSAGMGGRIEDQSRVNEFILGTRITGVGYTKGRVEIELVPSDRQAIFDAIFRGSTESDTVGRKGPALVYSSGTTRFAARKRLFLDGRGLRSLPAVSSARTRTTTEGIGSTKRGVVGNLVEKIAWKKVGQSKSQGERIAARRAELRINERMDEQSGRQLAEANRTFAERFRRPLLNRGQFPASLLFATTNEYLHVTAAQAKRGQLAADSAAPELTTSEPLLAVRLHESLVDNVADTAFAGREMSNEDFRELAVELLGKLPERLENPEDNEPWSIKFAERQPVTLDLKDGMLTITIRGDNFTAKGRKNQAMTITAEYRFEETPEGLKVVRVGELKIYPPGFRPGVDRLSAQQLTLRRLLTRKLGRVFESEIAVGELKLGDKLAALGNPKLVEHTVADGWLTLAWVAPDRVAETPEPATTSTDLAAAAR